MSADAGAEPTDLRRARRARGKTAVIDAALSFLSDGNAEPTAEQLAERAGVSTSSLFRYFESIDEMRSEAATRLIEHHGDLIHASPPDGASLSERVSAFVDTRIQVGEQFAPMMTTLQMRVNTTELGPVLARFRLPLQAMPDRYFRPELATLAPATRAELVALLDTLTSIEAWRHLTNAHERSPRLIKRAWTSAVDLLVREYAGTQ